MSNMIASQPVQQQPQQQGQSFDWAAMLKTLTPFISMAFQKRPPSWQVLPQAQASWGADRRADKASNPLPHLLRHRFSRVGGLLADSNSNKDKLI